MCQRFADLTPCHILDGHPAEVMSFVVQATRSGCVFRSASDMTPCRSGKPGDREQRCHAQTDPQNRLTPPAPQWHSGGCDLHCVGVVICLTTGWETLPSRWANRRAARH